jgi:hypothetical protein
MNKPPPHLDVRAIETRQTAVISTRHMSAKDNDLLTQRTGGTPHCFLASFEYGWLFYTPEGGDHEYDPEHWGHLGYSVELWENLRLLRDLGDFDRVEFDRDGPVIPGLHTFDW